MFEREKKSSKGLICSPHFFNLKNYVFWMRRVRDKYRILFGSFLSLHYHTMRWTIKVVLYTHRKACSRCLRKRSDGHKYTTGWNQEKDTECSLATCIIDDAVFDQVAIQVCGQHLEDANSKWIIFRNLFCVQVACKDRRIDIASNWNDHICCCHHSWINAVICCDSDLPINSFVKTMSVMNLHISKNKMVCLQIPIPTNVGL